MKRRAKPRPPPIRSGTRAFQSAAVREALEESFEATAAFIACGRVQSADARSCAHSTASTVRSRTRKRPRSRTMMPRASSGSAPRRAPGVRVDTPRLAPTARSVSSRASARASSFAPRDRRPHGAATTEVAQHLHQFADGEPRQFSQFHHVALTAVHPSDRNRPAERHDARDRYPDRVAEHFRELARERPLAALHALARPARDLRAPDRRKSRRQNRQPRHFGEERGVEQPCLVGLSSPL